MIKGRKVTNHVVFREFREKFAKVSKPEKDAPTIGKSLFTLSAQQLSDLQTNYTAWREYTEDLLTESLTELMIAKEDYSYHYDIELLKLAENLKVKTKEALLNTSEVLREKTVYLQQVELYHELLGKKFESYTNCLTVISREITRRGQDG